MMRGFGASNSSGNCIIKCQNMKDLTSWKTTPKNMAPCFNPLQNRNHHHTPWKEINYETSKASWYGDIAVQGIANMHMYVASFPDVVP